MPWSNIVISSSFLRLVPLHLHVKLLHNPPSTSGFSYLTMSLSIFLLWLVSIPLSLHGQTAPRGILLNCGASENVKTGIVEYIRDEGYISVGKKTSLTSTPDILPILSTLRHFPDKSARKYCYVFPVIKGEKYLVRTTYFYGGFDRGKEPPVFDQIIDGTKWSVVNTTEDYAKGLSSYYEIIVGALSKSLSVCLARNEHTGGSPFISAIELESLDKSAYNATDFTKYSLSTVARTSFGHDGDIISYPDDIFNRFWEPYKDDNPVVDSKSNVTSSDFWNVPPEKAFNRSLTASRGKSLKVQWPSFSLPNTSYYISLYFQDFRTPSPYSWRIFDVDINGKKFYSNLNATSNGVTVYSPWWPLSGTTEIVMTPAKDAPVGPVISAGEIYQILPVGGRTLTRDVVAMDDIARSFNNPPSDWKGDPCLPQGNSWTGVNCTMGKEFFRVSILNLTSMGLSGELSHSTANLTALTQILLGGNKISGNIPEIATIKGLTKLHLDNNEFEGSIPKSLGALPNIREIYLQNNKLDGDIPQSLKNKQGLDLQT